GIGRGQLKVLKKRVEKKRYIFNYYKQELSDLDDVQLMPSNNWNEPNYWLSSITLSGDVRPFDIIEALDEKNIESRPICKHMHMEPFFGKYYFIVYGVSKKLFENVFCLPSDTKMTDKELEKVFKVIKRLW